MDDADVKMHEARMNRVIDRVYGRGRLEEGPQMRNGRSIQTEVMDEIEEFASEGEELRIWMEAWSSFLRFILLEGIHPAKILKRFYAIAWACKQMGEVSQRDLAELLGEKPYSVSYRIKSIYSNFLLRWGQKGHLTPGQKREETREKYAAAARGNQARRKGEIAKSVRAAAEYGAKKNKRKQPTATAKK